MSEVECSSFREHTFKKDMCGNCYRPKDVHQIQEQPIRCTSASDWETQDSKFPEKKDKNDGGLEKSDEEVKGETKDLEEGEDPKVTKPNLTTRHLEPPTKEEEAKDPKATKPKQTSKFLKDGSVSGVCKPGNKEEGPEDSNVVERKSVEKESDSMATTPKTIKSPNKDGNPPKPPRIASNPPESPTDDSNPPELPTKDYKPAKSPTNDDNLTGVSKPALKATKPSIPNTKPRFWVDKPQAGGSLPTWARRWGKEMRGAQRPKSLPPEAPVPVFTISGEKSLVSDTVKEVGKKEEDDAVGASNRQPVQESGHYYHKYDVTIKESSSKKTGLLKCKNVQEISTDSAAMPYSIVAVSKFPPLIELCTVDSEPLKLPSTPSPEPSCNDTLKADKAKTGSTSPGDAPSPKASPRGSKVLGSREGSPEVWQKVQSHDELVEVESSKQASIEKNLSGWSEVQKNKEDSASEGKSKKRSKSFIRKLLKRSSRREEVEGTTNPKEHGSENLVETASDSAEEAQSVSTTSRLVQPEGQLELSVDEIQGNRAKQKITNTDRASIQASDTNENVAFTVKSVAGNKNLRGDAQKNVTWTDSKIYYLDSKTFPKTPNANSSVKVEEIVISDDLKQSEEKTKPLTIQLTENVPPPKPQRAMSPMRKPAVPPPCAPPPPPQIAPASEPSAPASTVHPFVSAPSASNALVSASAAASSEDPLESASTPTPASAEQAQVLSSKVQDTNLPKSTTPSEIRPVPEPAQNEPDESRLSVTRESSDGGSLTRSTDTTFRHRGRQEAMHSRVLRSHMGAPPPPPTAPSTGNNTLSLTEGSETSGSQLTSPGIPVSPVPHKPSSPVNTLERPSGSDKDVAFTTERELQATEKIGVPTSEKKGFLKELTAIVSPVKLRRTKSSLRSLEISGPIDPRPLTGSSALMFNTSTKDVTRPSFLDDTPAPKKRFDSVKKHTRNRTLTEGIPVMETILQNYNTGTGLDARAVEVLETGSSKFVNRALPPPPSQSPAQAVTSQNLSENLYELMPHSDTNIRAGTPSRPPYEHIDPEGIYHDPDDICSSSESSPSSSESPALDHIVPVQNDIYLEPMKTRESKDRKYPDIIPSSSLTRTKGPNNFNLTQIPQSTPPKQTTERASQHYIRPYINEEMSLDQDRVPITMSDAFRKMSVSNLQTLHTLGEQTYAKYVCSEPLFREDLKWSDFSIGANGIELTLGLLGFYRAKCSKIKPHDCCLMVSGKSLPLTLLDLCYINLVNPRCMFRDRISADYFPEPPGSSSQVYQLFGVEQTLIAVLGYTDVQGLTGYVQHEYKRHRGNEQRADFERTGCYVMVQILNGLLYLHEKDQALTKLHPNDVLMVTSPSGETYPALNLPNPVKHAEGQDNQLFDSIIVIIFLLLKIQWKNEEDPYTAIPNKSKYSCAFRKLVSMLYQKQFTLQSLITARNILEYTLWGPTEDEVLSMCRAQDPEQAFSMWLDVTRCKLVNQYAVCKTEMDLEQANLVRFLCSMTGNALYDTVRILDIKP